MSHLQSLQMQSWRTGRPEGPLALKGTSRIVTGDVPFRVACCRQHLEQNKQAPGKKFLHLRGPKVASFPILAMLFAPSDEETSKGELAASWNRCGKWWLSLPRTFCGPAKPTKQPPTTAWTSGLPKAMRERASDFTRAKPKAQSLAQARRPLHPNCCVSTELNRLLRCNLAIQNLSMSAKPKGYDHLGSGECCKNIWFECLNE